MPPRRSRRWTTCRWRCAPARAPRSSAPAARANQRCCASSPASRPPSAVPSRSTDGMWPRWPPNAGVSAWSSNGRCCSRTSRCSTTSRSRTEWPGCRAPGRVSAPQSTSRRCAWVDTVAVASKSSPAARNSAWPSPGRSPRSRRCCCSTSPSAPSTRRCAPTCTTSSRRCAERSRRPSSSSRTTATRRRGWPTASRSWRTGDCCTRARSPRPTVARGPSARHSSWAGATPSRGRSATACTSALSEKYPCPTRSTVPRPSSSGRRTSGSTPPREVRHLSGHPAPSRRSGRSARAERSASVPRVCSCTPRCRRRPDCVRARTSRCRCRTPSSTRAELIGAEPVTE